MYLDIQTTDDPSKPEAKISSIVWWCNEQWHSWVKGKNDPEEFLVFWRNSPRIITFNGKVLDEPKICKEFNVSPHVIHRDLFFDVQRKGLPPNLKKISRLSDFPRSEEVEAVDEQATVKLWKKFNSEPTSQALQSLLCCSAWEIVHTYHLHCHLSNAKPIPMHETIPFSVDTEFLKSFAGIEHKNKTQRVIVAAESEADKKTEKPFIKIKRPVKPPSLKIDI
jgi:uncharacterized protein YprB with RNaseH-like and TPR domain